MSTEYNQKYKTSHSDDELDLGRLFYKFIEVIKKRKIILLICISIGLILSTLLYIISSPIYKSTMVVNSSLLTSANTASLLETLDNLIKEGNHKELSKKLGFSLNASKSLNEIKVVSIEDEDAPELVYIYQIQVKVANNQILDSLQAGIINYLEKSPYVKRRIDIKKQNILALIDRIQNEMVELDSLKDMVNNNLVSRSQNSNILIMEPVNVYREAITLYQKELELQRDLVLVDNIQILEDFTVFLKPVSPKLSLIFYGFFGGFLLGLATIAVLEFLNWKPETIYTEKKIY